MNTTTLLAELLVVGISSLIWIKPLLIRIIPDSPYLDIALDSPVAWAAVIYLLGIVVNFLADRFFSKVESYYADVNGGKIRHKKIRSKIFLESEAAASYMLTRRGIVRILRACSFNVFVLSLLNFTNIAAPLLRFSGFFSGVFLLVSSGLVFLAFRHALIGYFQYLVVTEEVLKERPGSV